MPLLPDDPRRIGRWELSGRLGTGGFGTVFDGIEPGGRRGAVKTMHPHLAEQPEFLARFGREITFGKRVRGNHVARVLDYDLHGEPPFLVTEFVEGPTLHDAVETEGPLEGDNLYALALALAEAVSQITAAGVIHRDLKPSNVILTERCPVLVDFGIASSTGLSRLTSTGTVLGTWPYMAPEQFTGAEADHAIDVFAWASVVTFAANGSPPFGTDQNDASVVMHRVLNEQPDHGCLDGPLADLVASAHEKSPAERPTIPEVVSRLVEQRAPVGSDPAHTSTMLVEQTWHLPDELAPGAASAAVSATEVQPAPEPPSATELQPAPGPPAAPQGPYPQVVYTPPRVEPALPAPQPAPQPAPPPPPGWAQPQQAWGQPGGQHQPPPQPQGGEKGFRYPGFRTAPWVAKMPRFGYLGLIATGVYIGFGAHFDSVDDGVPLTSPNQADLEQTFETAWSLRPLVVFIAFAFIALRVTRSVVRRRGLTSVQWRIFAAVSSLETMALAQLPGLAAVVLGYGPGVLEPNDRITTEMNVAAAIVLVVMLVLTVVGLVYAIIGLVNLFRSLLGTVAR